MKLIPFIKMHGIGNDFIIVDARDKSLLNFDKFAARICDRRKGVGCDQLLIVEKSNQAYAFMKIYNNDGSVAQMCGNGIRCVARYLKDKDLLKKDEIFIDTLAGIKRITLYDENEAEVEMGRPDFDPQKIPVKSENEVLKKMHSFGDFKYEISCVSMGNPHCVLIGDGKLAEKVAIWGPIIERDTFFPERTNVEFVEILNGESLKVAVWERGTGVTLACGSGAVASAATCNKLGLTGKKVTAKMPGGDLKITLNDQETFMRGAVKKVYDGTFDAEVWNV